MALTRVVGTPTLLTGAFQTIETLGAKANIVSILLNNTSVAGAVRPEVHLVPDGGNRETANKIYNDEIPAGKSDAMEGPVFAGNGSTIQAKGAGVSIIVSRVEGV